MRGRAQQKASSFLRGARGGWLAVAPAQRFAAPPRPRRPQPLFYYKPPALRPLLACSIFPPLRCAHHHQTPRRRRPPSPRLPRASVRPSPSRVPRSAAAGEPRLLLLAPLSFLPLLCCLALPLSLSLSAPWILLICCWSHGNG
jgi:hypothetical protein